METTVGDFFISQNRAEGHNEDLSDIIEMAKLCNPQLDIE